MKEEKDIRILSLLTSGVYINEIELKGIAEKADYRVKTEGRLALLSELHSAATTEQKKVLQDSLTTLLERRQNNYTALNEKYPDAAALIDSWKVRVDKMIGELKTVR